MSIIFRHQTSGPLTSDQVDGNFQYLLDRLGESGLMVPGGYSYDGLNLTMAQGWVWRLFGNNYVNAVEFNYTALPTTSGQKRVEVACGDVFGNISVITGPSGPGEIDPPIPNGFARLLRFVVQGSTIIEFDEVLSKYIKKPIGLYYFENVGGNLTAGSITEVRPNVVFGSYTGTGGVTGFTAAADSGIFSGMYISIENSSTESIPLKHLATGTMLKYKFPNGQDYILEPGEIITMRLDTLSSRRLLFVGSSFVFTSKSFIMGSSRTLPASHNQRTYFIDLGTLTINPNTQNYEDSFAISAAATGPGNIPIVLTASTDWNYIIEGSFPVESGTIYILKGGTATIIRKGNSKTFIINGSLI